MILTQENYHSKEANKEFLSVSQYKDFSGCAGMRGCEAKAMAKISGEWHEEATEAMLIGSYVDAYVEGTLKAFKEQNKCEKKTGGLFAWCEKAEAMIKRFERDKVFMGFLKGQKQVIMTAELFGAMWKIKIDNLGADFITDLKTAMSLTKSTYHADTGRISFVEQWGYDIQGAIYPSVVQKVQGTQERLPMYFAAVSKEEHPDILVIQLDEMLIRNALVNVERDIPRILALKRGEVEPDRCELCDYCRSTKVLKAPIMASALVTK